MLVVVWVGGVYGLVYIIGGGLIENLLCVLLEGFGVDIDLFVWELFVVFCWLVEIVGMVESELLKIFNLGIGMIVVVVVDCVDVIVEVLIVEGEIVIKIGIVIVGEGVCYFGKLL